jgi:hypothetical protein
MDFEDLDEGLDKLMDFLKDLKLVLISVHRIIAQESGQLDEGPDAEDKHEVCPVRNPEHEWRLCESPPCPAGMSRQTSTICAFRQVPDGCAQLPMGWMRESKAWLLVSKRYHTGAAVLKRQLSICMQMYKLARRSAPGRISAVCVQLCAGSMRTRY